MNHRHSAVELGTVSSNLESRRLYRLSKPRPINSISSFNLKSMSNELGSSPSSSEQTLPGSGNDAVVTSPSGECRSRRESRQALRAHLFGPELEANDDTYVDAIEEKRGFVETATRGMRDRLSRTSTILSQRSKRGSLTPLNTSQSKLVLVPDLPHQDLDDPERIIDQIKEKAFHDSLAALNHVSSPIDEEIEPNIITSPIRRRSLFTPGLATRVPSDILRKPPPLPQRSTTTEQFDQNYYYNPNHSECSPLSALASLDLANLARFSPIPRAPTPSDLAYSHLGGLRLGTLRITNGNASPVPRAHSPTASEPDRSPGTKHQEDYFTASEGRASDDEDTHSVSIAASACKDDTVHKAGPSIFTGKTTAALEIVGRPTPASTTWTGPTDPPSHESEPHLLRHPETSVEQHGDNVIVSTPSKVPEVNGATVLAASYIAELPLTPFKDYFEPGWVTNEFEDRDYNMGAGSTTSQPGSSAWTSSRNEPEKGQSTIGSHDLSLQCGHSSSIGSIPGSGPATDDPSVMIKQSHTAIESIELHSLSLEPNNIDSGYGSSSYSTTTSMGSVKRKPVADRDRSQPSRSRPISLSSSPHISGPRDMPHRSTEKPRPASDILAGIATKKTDVKDDNMPLKRASTLLVPKPILLSFHSKSSAGNSAETVTTLASTNTSYSAGSSGQRKLQKARPRSLPPPVNRITVQGQRTLLDLNVPPVPIMIAEMHAERLQRFPQLEHTFPSSHHTDLRDNLEEPPPLFVPIRFPSPVPSLDQANSSSNRINEIMGKKSDKSSRRSPLKRNSTFRSRSSSRTERRSSQQQLLGQYDVARAIADFGDVTESLGGSPYDAARSAMWATPPVERNASLAHPHQMTIATPRAKNGMSEEQAAELARLRSLDRQSSIPTFERSTSGPSSMTVAASFDVPHTPTRISRRSFHDRGGIPGKLPRPRSMYADIPPIPAMPSPEQLLEKEAEVCKSRSSGSPSTSPYRVNDDQSKVVKSLDWEDHRKAWARRRRSAGDGILKSPDCLRHPQSRTDGRELKHQEIRAPSRPPPPPPILHNPQFLDVPKAPSRRPPPPPPHGNDFSMSKNASTTSLQSMNSTESNVQRLSGRYDGGLNFGYEPGLGVGGSAGTRNMKTGASRKSVQVSMGYGIDLSDVPIFVASSSAR